MALQTVTFSTLEYEAARNISASHAFTTRLGGVSQGHLASLNLGANRGDTSENVAENYGILSRALGFDPSNLVLTHQVHGDTVRVVSAKDCLGLNHKVYPECDALVTNQPGTALAVFTADCTPILLWDSATGAVGAVHAGWRSTAADIAGKAVAVMAEAFGSKPENIRAAIGPNIGACCFETDADVPDALLRTYGARAEQWIQPRGNKFYVNLKAINALSLNRAGVTDVQISTSCTACQPHRFWSHRVTRGLRGSQGAIIICKEGTK